MIPITGIKMDPGQKFQVVNGQITKEIVVHRFDIDLDACGDSVVAAGAPLYDWEQSEAGQWVISHAVEKPRWERYSDPRWFIDMFAVVARLSEPDITFWKLKYT